MNHKEIIMRSFPEVLLSFSFLIALGAVAADGQVSSCTEPARVAVEIEEPVTMLTTESLAKFVGLEPATAVLEAVGKAQHGDIEWSESVVLYTPDDDFWSLRSDRFTYQVSGSTGDPEAPKTLRFGFVQLVAHLSASTSMLDNFEISLEHCGWTVDDPAGQLSLAERPLGSGHHWLRVPAGGSLPALLSLVPDAGLPGLLSWPPQCSDNPTHGTTDDCFTMHFATPPSPSFTGEVTFFRAHLDGEDGQDVPPLELRLRRGIGEVLEVYATDGVGCATPAVKLGSHDVTLQLDLWRDHGHGGGAGMLLRVDDRATGLVRCLSPLVDHLVETELGLVELATVESPRLEVDNFGIGDRDPEWTLPAAGWRIETFECGTLDDWVEAGIWTPRITREASLSGGAGLEIDLAAIAESSTDHGFLHDAAPVDLTTFNLRFRLDPHTASLSDGETLVLAGGSDGDLLPSDEHLALELSGDSEALLLRVRELDDSETSHVTAWTGLGAAGVAHVVELQWRAASSPATSDGLVRLWIDGVLRGEVFGIDNDTRRVESLQVGALDVPSRTQGTLYLDDVETWN